jgi:hypothetical protein
MVINFVGAANSVFGVRPYLQVDDFRRVSPETIVIEWKSYA